MEIIPLWPRYLHGSDLLCPIYLVHFRMHSGAKAVEPLYSGYLLVR